MEDEERDEKERLERRRAKHKDREFGAEALLVKDDAEWLTDGLWSAFGGVQQGTKNGASPRKAARDADKKKDAYASVRETLASLSLQSFSKVTPNRVYCSAFHPTVDKDLLIMGDKLGAVGIWDASSTPSVPPVKTEANGEDVDAKAADAQEPDEEEVTADADGPNRGNAFVVQAHSRNAISAIKVDPLNAHQVYTASYDSTIRMLNFETHMSVEIVDGDALDDDSGDALFSAIDFANEGRELWASDNQGGLTHRDLREPKQKAKRWQVQEKKVGCVNLCPIGGQKWAVTAGLNREMRCVSHFLSNEIELTWGLKGSGISKPSSAPLRLRQSRTTSLKLASPCTPTASPVPRPTLILPGLGSSAQATTISSGCGTLGTTRGRRRAGRRSWQRPM